MVTAAIYNIWHNKIMQFVDECKIYLKAGKGGDGIIA
jgi:hypothetical protein